MNFSVVLFLIGVAQLINFQTQIPNLWDNMVWTSSGDKVQWSMNIASKFTHTDWESAIYYIDEFYSSKDSDISLEHNHDKISKANFYKLIFGLLVVVLVLIILLFRYNHKLKHAEMEKHWAITKEKELNAHLELKNKELIGKMMIEMHRTATMKEIIKDLERIRLKAYKKEPQKEIDNIVQRLNRNTSTNVWEEFEVRFEQVHESFYKNLIKRHPDLTPREKRLSALLKLNLTSKEISLITGQSSKSVENARTRLRKKLDITNSQIDLSSYLSDFD